MNKDLDKAIYSALNKHEATSSLGSSAAANEILELVKPYYKSGTSEEKQEVLVRLEKLRQEPGVPFPTNVEQLLNS